MGSELNDLIMHLFMILYISDIFVNRKFEKKDRSLYKLSVISQRSSEALEYASKKVCLEVSSEKTKYILMSRFGRHDRGRT
jgi:hypothetical protein